MSSNSLLDCYIKLYFIKKLDNFYIYKLLFDLVYISLTSS